jgi:DNA-directed RNA polymerase subunit K
MRYTRFEIARIIGARALQLSLGAPPLLNLSKEDLKKSPLEIAKMEFEKGVIPLTVKRKLPEKVE